MKKFKVELMRIEKQYASTVIEAENKEEAIEKARNVDLDTFYEKEKVVSHEWKAQSNWSFYNALMSIFIRRD